MIEYFENYVNNYAVVFDNYAHFSKIRRNYASTFSFKFGQNTSITMQQRTTATVAFQHGGQNYLLACQSLAC